LAQVTHILISDLPTTLPPFHSKLMSLYFGFVLSAVVWASPSDIAGGGTGLRGSSPSKPQEVVAEAVEGPVPYLLPLHREKVPVKQNGKVISFKTAYSGKISVGSPAVQEFSVVFDTGSGHVLLPSQGCDSNTCKAHQRYNITKSDKAAAVNADGSKVPDDELCDQATIGYGTGTVTGEFVHDSVCLGVPEQPQATKQSVGVPASENNNKNKICTTMNMVVAVEMSAQPFESFKFDGIFGLGLDSLALSSEFSFFSRLSAQAASKKSASFGFFLSDGEHGEQSELAVGGHNSDRLMGPLSWAPVAMPKAGFWNVKIRSVRIGGVDVANCKKGGCKGILDTGTSHLGVPSQHIESITDLLSKNVADSEDCRSVEAPTLSIDINGFTITLGPEDYMPSRPASSAPLAIAGPGPESKAAAVHRCQPRVMPVNMQKPLGPNLFLLGEPVLHRYYTVYDWHKQRVGFGLANSHKNRLRNGEKAAATATATVKVEALDALEGEDEEIYLMQMSVSITWCEEEDSAVPVLNSPLQGNTFLLS